MPSHARPAWNSLQLTFSPYKVESPEKMMGIFTQRTMYQEYHMNMQLQSEFCWQLDVVFNLCMSGLIFLCGSKAIENRTECLALVKLIHKAFN